MLSSGSNLSSAEPDVPATRADENVTVERLPPPPARSPLVIVLILAGGVFFAGFDQTFVVTILPDMMPDLDITVDRFGRAAWIVNGYLLGYTVALPFMGRVADVYGRIRIYLLSTLIYVVGSAGVALAPNLPILTAARAVQAVGGGAIVPISLALASASVPARHRALALGCIVAADDLSSLLGPLYAATLVDWLGWRGLFWLNIPLQLPWLLGVALLLPSVPGALRERIDWRGGIFLAASLSCLTIGLTRETGGATAPWITGLWLVAAVLSSLGLVLTQRSSAFPLLPVRSLRKRQVRVGLLLYFLDGAAAITLMICIPLMTNVLWEGTPLQGGLNLMKMMLWMPVGAVAGGLLVRVLGYRLTAALAFALVAAAYGLMYRWPDVPSPAQLWVTLFLGGFGIGLNNAPILGSVLDHVPAGERATAAGMTKLVQVTGMITGTALLATQGIGRFDERAAALFRERGLAAGYEEYRAILRATFDEIFLVAALALLVGVVLSLFLSGGRPARPHWAPTAALAEESSEAPSGDGRRR